jgi:hypothetical protein
MLQINRAIIIIDAQLHRACPVYELQTQSSILPDPEFINSLQVTESDFSDLLEILPIESKNPGDPMINHKCRNI